MCLASTKRILRTRVGVLIFFVICPLLIVHHLWFTPDVVKHVKLWSSNSIYGHRELSHGKTSQPKKLVNSQSSLQELANHPGYLGNNMSPDDLALADAEALHVIASDPNGPQHDYLPSGLVVPNPKGQHPIFDLIARAQKQWQTKLNKASITLTEAVDEYVRRYNRAPPKGFDRWWRWAKDNNVQLPDEYDQINADLEPFFALTPDKLGKLRDEAKKMSGMFTISCKDHQCNYALDGEGLNDEGYSVATERAEAHLGLIKDIADKLENVEAVFFSHDVPWQFVGHDYKASLKESASLGEFWDGEDEDFDKAHLGWASACAPYKPLRAQRKNPPADLERLWQEPNKTFIWDHKAVMDPCENPDLVHVMGSLSRHGKGPGPSFKMYPVLSMCKTTLNPDILGVSVEAWTEDVGDDPKWDEKPYNRLLWRGKTTGIFFKDSNPWNISQRVNLVEHADRHQGQLPVTGYAPPGKPVGLPTNKTWNEVNKLLDVGFVDEPIQCDEDICKVLKDEYRFADRKSYGDANNYKYLLDVDGNGWSARFKRLMTTNSVVLKSTVFPEWYADRIQPWVHYVPIKPDLTDLYDVMTFFHDGNDVLGKQLAAAGKAWSRTFWRREDMVAYQFRLFLELSRLLSPNREAASYKHVR